MRKATRARLALAGLIAPGHLYDSVREEGWFVLQKYESADAQARAALKVTVRFFQTGTVIVAGAREPAHIAVAHDFACRVLDDNYADVCRVDAKTSLRTTTASKRLDLTQGYATNQFNACFMAQA